MYTCMFALQSNKVFCICSFYVEGFIFAPTLQTGFAKNTKKKLTVIVSFVYILTPDVLHTRHLTALATPARATGTHKLSQRLRAHGVVTTRPLRSAHVHQVLRNK